MCVTDRHDMTLAVKVALNPNKNKQTSKLYRTISALILKAGYETKAGRRSVKNQD